MTNQFGTSQVMMEEMFNVSCAACYRCKALEIRANPKVYVRTRTCLILAKRRVVERKFILRKRVRPPFSLPNSGTFAFERRA